MDRVYRYIVLMSAALLPLAAAAQNLDPTVEVSRAYEGNLVEVHKPVMEISVPDTVRHFRLDFDYSVFDSPYKGSYEFNPYMASMRPAASEPDLNTFYLKAGAGYRLHPSADLIWSPSFRKGFRLDVYANHRSYVGDYRNTSFDSYGTGWKGYDLKTKAGVCGRYEWRKGTLDFDVAYLGVHSKDTIKHRGLDAVDVSFGIASKQARTFVYDVDVDYRFADDKVNGHQAGTALREHLFSIDADLGPQFNVAHRILFDLGADLAFASGASEWGNARMHITPHYVFNKGRWQIDAGAKIDFLVGSDAPQQIIYPDVHVEFTVIRNAMNLYAKAVGGTSLNTYSGLVSRNHFADPSYIRGKGLDSNIERVRALAGFKGRIGSRFSYDVRGGYAGYANHIFDAVLKDGSRFLPAVGFSSFQKAFAEIDCLFDSERFRFDGTVSYSHFWGFQSSQPVFAPASFVADASLEYNIRKRIFFGVDCLYTSERVMTGLFEGQEQPLKVPSFTDLGVSLEVAVSRKLSFWARGGNLLNMTIRRTPFYAEGGIYFTAGICLKL